MTPRCRRAFPPCVREPGLQLHHCLHGRRGGPLHQALRRLLCAAAGPTPPTGVFNTPVNYPWRLLSGPCYGQYATRINGPYLFHSVPYYTQHKDDLEYDEFNKLGTQASLGCIRLAIADVRWIYETAPSARRWSFTTTRRTPAPWPARHPADRPPKRKPCAAGTPPTWTPQTPGAPEYLTARPSAPPPPAGLGGLPRQRRLYPKSHPHRPAGLEPRQRHRGHPRLIF